MTICRTICLERHFAKVAKKIVFSDSLLKSCPKRQSENKKSERPVVALAVKKSDLLSD